MGGQFRRELCDRAGCRRRFPCQGHPGPRFSVQLSVRQSPPTAPASGWRTAGYNSVTELDASTGSLVKVISGARLPIRQPRRRHLERHSCMGDELLGPNGHRIERDYRSIGEGDHRGERSRRRRRRPGPRVGGELLRSVSYVSPDSTAESDHYETSPHPWWIDSPSRSTPSARQRRTSVSGHEQLIRPAS